MFAKLGTLGVDKKMITYPFTFHDWWTDGTKTANTMDELKNGLTVIRKRQVTKSGIVNY